MHKNNLSELLLPRHGECNPNSAVETSVRERPPNRLIYPVYSTAQEKTFNKSAIADLLEWEDSSQNPSWISDEPPKTRDRGQTAQRVRRESEWHRREPGQISREGEAMTERFRESFQIDDKRKKKMVSLLDRPPDLSSREEIQSL